jgi:creatinine amidohydrolase
VLHWAEQLPWTELKALAEGGALAVLGIGATEAHGPHLPLNVDVIIANEVVRRMAPLLDIDVVAFPTVAYSLTDFAAPFSGTISLDAAVAQAWLLNVLRGIAQSGFQRVGLVNHHLEPAHFKMLHRAAKEAQTLTGIPMLVADHRRPPTGPLLGDEFMTGGSHAGTYETSLMLAAAPHLVDEAARQALPALEVNLVAAIQAGAHNFLQCGGAQAYFGDPKKASAAEGERLFEILAQFTARCFAPGS